MSSTSTITFHCSNCDAELEVPAHMAGVEGPCPRCRTNISSPKSEESPFLEKSEPPEPKPELPADEVRKEAPTDLPGRFSWVEAGFLLAFLLATIIVIAVMLPAAGLANLWGLGSEAPQSLVTPEKVKTEPLDDAVEVPEDQADEVEPIEVPEVKEPKEEKKTEPEPEWLQELEPEPQPKPPKKDVPLTPLKGGFPDFTPPKFDEAPESE